MQDACTAGHIVHVAPSVENPGRDVRLGGLRVQVSENHSLKRGGPLFSWDGEMLVLSSRGVRQIIRCTSDLLSAPWYGVIDREWNNVAMQRRNILADFYALVGSGSVKLVSRGVEAPDSGVLFDAPLPVLLNGLALRGAIVRRSEQSTWWEREVPDLERKDGPMRVTREHCVPEGGFGVERGEMQVSGPILAKVTPFWSRGDGRAECAGMVHRIDGVASLSRPVFMGYSDKLRYRGWDVLFDLDLMEDNETIGCKRHLAGEGRGVSIIKGPTSLGPRYETRRVPTEVDIGCLVYIPPMSTIIDVVRGALMIGARMRGKSISVKRLARELGVSEGVTLAALSSTSHSKVTSGGCGCYLDLHRKYKGEQHGPLTLRPKRAGELVGTLIVERKGRGYVVVPAMEPVCTTNGHIQMCELSTSHRCRGLRLLEAVRGQADKAYVLQGGCGHNAQRALPTDM